MLAIFKSIIPKVRTSGIYAILNKITGKVYIGSATNINVRRYTHMKQLSENKHHSVLLQRSYNKYGADAFEFIVLEIVEDRKLLLGREQYWLDLHECFNPKFGYNLSPTAGSILGIKYSTETRARMSAAMTDKRKAHLSAHFKGKICGPRSEEIKNKIKATLKGHVPSNETKAKIREGVKRYNLNKRDKEIANFAIGII